MLAGLTQLGRFAQADTIVPGGVQGYDRYAYVNNNPMNGTDPSGHKTVCNSGYDTTRSCRDDGKGNGNPAPALAPTPNVSGGNNPPTTIVPAIVPTATPGPNDIRTGPVVYKAATPQTQVCSTPIPGASNCFAPQPQYGAELSLADAIGYGSLAISTGEAMFPYHVPGAIGMAIDGFAQLSRDSGKDYNVLQTVTRASLVAVEGQVVNGVTLETMAVAGIGGAVTGPGDAVIVGGAYLVGSLTYSKGADYLNENIFFPIIGGGGAP
jgi:hypothetical protein